jgi:hypothetical protein
MSCSFVTQISASSLKAASKFATISGSSELAKQFTRQQQQQPLNDAPSSPAIDTDEEFDDDYDDHAAPEGKFYASV